MNAPAPRRLSKFKREPKAVADKKLTARSLQIIAAIARYRFLPTSLLVRLVEGNEDVTHRHLQQLFHKGLINRFAFPKTGGSNEFNYYLDSAKALALLVEQGFAEKRDLDFEGVQRNKEKAYHKINDAPDDSAGRMLFLKHELMISRFHFMLELGCKNSEGHVELANWKQGPQLHSSVTDHETGEVLPHRPDAFFTLRFPTEPEGQNTSHFLYEADRNRTSLPKMLVKLKAHFEFVRQKKHQDVFRIKRVRAVLIETLDTKWAEELRQASAPICPVPLFWFTASEIFSSPFLAHPEIVLKKVWATTGNDAVVALSD
jgi:hypothetical protein